MIVKDSIMYRPFDYPSTFEQSIRREDAWASYCKREGIFKQNAKDLLEYLKFIEENFNKNLGGLMILVRSDWYIYNKEPMIIITFKNKNWSSSIAFNYFDMERDSFKDQVRWYVYKGIMKLIEGTLGIELI